MLTLILIVNFQARLTQELESQMQEVASLGAEVDEHVVTRSVLGERRGHQIIQVMRSWLPLELRRNITYKERLDSMKMNMVHLVAQLQSRMPDIQNIPVPSRNIHSLIQMRKRKTRRRRLKIKTWGMIKWWLIVFFYFCQFEHYYNFVLNIFTA